MQPTAISGESVGARTISMATGALPSGKKVSPHCHPYEETVFALTGVHDVRFGPNLEHIVEVKAGDMVFIPAYVVHAPENTSTDAASFVICRAWPEEVILPPGGSTS